MRRRKILEYAPGQRHGQVGMDVGEARHDEFVRAVDPLCIRILREDSGAVADRRNSPAVDRDRRPVVNRIAVIDSGDGGIVNDGDQTFPQYMTTVSI